MSKTVSLRITHSALSKLERSQVWLTSGFYRRVGFRAEEIYGPEGKLNWLWTLIWEEPTAMRSDLCTNMGGGVPIDVIEALVSICLVEAGEG